MIYVNVYISTNPEFAIYDICTNSEFASRIGRLGFFVYLVKVSHIPRALLLFDKSLVVEKKLFLQLSL